MPEIQKRYTGRFAPTPSGPLHFGSIIAALGSYLDARSSNGRWLVRIDDLDNPRVRPGAADNILRALETLGLQWDSSVLYQSQRLEAYEEALEYLQSRDLVYPCYCPRRQVKGKPYPGTCRNREKQLGQQHAFRLLTGDDIYTLHDQVQPDFSQDLSVETGDFIIKRADGIFAYHLAVVLDDAYQDVTHMVRGADLLASCPRQIYLQQQLELTTPTYAHLPLAVTASGEKISKQCLNESVLLTTDPVSLLYNCLEFLGQKPGKELLKTPVNELLQWAIANWKLSAVPARKQIVAPEGFHSRNT